jgi:hypothetical protein
MSLHLVIRIDERALRTAAPGQPMTLRIDRGRAPEPAHADSHGTDEARIYREGSLPRRLVDWAQSRRRAFGTDDVTEALAISRPHASMLLGKLVKDPGPIRRVARGVYGFDAPPDARKQPAKSRRRPTNKK